MPQIDLRPQTHQEVTLLAKAWAVDGDTVVRRLLDAFRSTSPQSEVSQFEGVRVFAIYEGKRTNGLYDAKTGGLTITNGPLEGKSYRTPSGAAAAVVQSMKPAVHPNRNGWTFWWESETASPLQHRRAADGR
jgi:hypothetical protein